MSARPTFTLLATCCAIAIGSAARAADDARAVAAAKENLLKLAAEAEKVAEVEYDTESWTKMRAALHAARGAANRNEAGVSDLAAARDALRASANQLVKRRAVPHAGPRLGLSAAPFAIDPAGPANNVALMWAAADPGDDSEVHRAASQSGPFEKVYAGTGASYKDYDLPIGTHYYRLTSIRNGKRLTSGVAAVTTMALPPGLKAYSNERPNDEGLPGGGLKVGDTYYDFPLARDGRAVKVLMRTSPDGKAWTDRGVVMDAASHPDVADAKFEAVSTFYDAAGGRFVYWCHWERSGPSYGAGRALVASAKPGERFTVHRVFNPLGIEVRDMSVFVDPDDKRGYLAAASNVPGQGANATLYVFQLNEAYDDVVRVVAKVVENGYREAPHIVKRDGLYYLFFSQAAGWYPSRGGYVSAKSLDGPWSEPREIGSPSTFSSQSGHILEFGDAAPHGPLMMGNRWVRGEGTSRNAALPIRFADGFAFYDYAPALLHDAARNLLVPLDAGRLLSQDKPARASIAPAAGGAVAKAFDGDYFSAFRSDQKIWPFDLVTDLGAPATVRNVQVSWFLHKGSEAFYTYTIEGSPDGRQWTTLVDHADPADKVVGKTYGFTSDEPPATAPAARYVKLTVRRAHLHNNPSNWYPPTVYEVKVFGTPAK